MSESKNAQERQVMIDMTANNEWSDAELDEIEKLCAPLVKYLQTNHRRCDIHGAIIVMYDGVLFAGGGEGGNVYFPFKVPD